MKNLQKFAWLGAIALACTVSFSSCSSDDDPYVGPDGERLGVKTEFIISFPGGKASTRMTDVETQAANTYQDIGTPILIPFDKEFTGTQSRWAANLTLTKPAETTNASGDVPATEHHYLYSKVTVPFGTKAFLAYVPVGSPVNGKLTLPTMTGEPKDFQFSLTNMEAEDSDDVLDYLNAAFDETGWNGNNNDAGLDGLYERYTSLKSGSSENAINTVNDLLASMKMYESSIAKAVVEKLEAATPPSSKFPVNLPDGAVVLKFENGAFAWANETDNVGLDVAEQTRYAYPPYIYYKANTTILTSETSKSTEYENGVDWSDILAKYDGGDEVTSTTQSVALKDNLQYAIGRLETSIKIAETGYHATMTIDGKSVENVIEYKAKVNKIVVGDDGTESVTPVDETRYLPLGSGFALKGIVISEQRPVNWDFRPIANGTESYLYDGKVTNAVATNTTTVAKNNGKDITNSTLVMETDATEVPVALEFVNNTGSRIVVKKGVIEKGATFYLVGKLVKSKNTNTTSTANKIFEQDFVTKATFSISAQGLYDNATNVIPDMETPELELGLSVDLVWQPGHVYEVELGGNTTTSEGETPAP